MEKRTKQWIAGALVALFGIVMLPPVLWQVNSPDLVGGVPVLYTWAIVWSVFAIGVMWWAASADLFGISDAQTPPELRGEGVGIREDTVRPAETRDSDPVGGDS